jgi:methyl-accepting chemotaxis protein
MDAFNGTLHQSIDPITGTIGELIKLPRDEGTIARGQNTEVDHRVRDLMLTVVLLFVAMGLLGVWWVAGSISRPVDVQLKALRSADQDTDLCAQVALPWGHTISEVASAYNNMLQRFARVIEVLQPPKQRSNISIKAATRWHTLSCHCSA